MSATIMTVDDSASVRQMVRLTLQDAGYTVIEARDGTVMDVVREVKPFSFRED